MNIASSEYAQKPNHYFSGARKAFVDDLPLNPQAKPLEVGCGDGDTAAYAPWQLGSVGGVRACSCVPSQRPRRLGA